jgi:hypothetical protein
MIFSAAFKVYANLSGRRFTCDLEESQRHGHSADPSWDIETTAGFEDIRQGPTRRRKLSAGDQSYFRLARATR